jgi:hypothetical protein
MGEIRRSRQILWTGLPARALLHSNPDAHCAPYTRASKYGWWSRRISNLYFLGALGGG